MPEPNTSQRIARPSAGDRHGWLEACLELVPFPALLVETETGGVLGQNQAARLVPLSPADLPPEQRDGSFALTAGGQRIDAAALAAHLATAATGPEGAEITWYTPGRSVVFRVFSRRVPPSDGDAALSVLTFLDVTRQKAGESELRQALEARDEFFSVATHELKDPLFSLHLSIQLLKYTADKQGSVPGYVQHHLEVSQRQVDRLSRLIENLLDVSRILNHRLQLDPEAIDLCELAHDVVGRFQERAAATGTMLTADTGEPVIGYFDRMKIEQVLSNLLGNALKYGAGKPVSVRVYGEDGTAVVEVCDRGPGIAPENHQRIFERFERASPGHKKESLGLGLYIVRSFVEAHGGSVRVQSEPGQGARFTVRLPRKRLHRQEDGPEEATES